MSAMEMTNVVNASQSGKRPEVEISRDGTAVSASEGELLVAVILRHKVRIEPEITLSRVS
jgi:hypothetical protein